MAFGRNAGDRFLVRIGGGANGGDPGRGMVSLLRVPGNNTDGVCCIGANCTLRAPGDCNLLGGTFRGHGTLCSPNPWTPASVSGRH